VQGQGPRQDLEVDFLGTEAGWQRITIRGWAGAREVFQESFFRFDIRTIIYLQLLYWSRRVGTHPCVRRVGVNSPQAFFFSSFTSSYFVFLKHFFFVSLSSGCIIG
jgi:hypothetical protein